MEGEVQQMDKMIDECETKETQVLLEEHETSNDQSVEIDDLSFPWPLIHILTEYKERNKLKFISDMIKRLLLSFRLKLLTLFGLCIAFIAVGGCFSNEWYKSRMLCIYFIVQGSCGLFVVFMHTLIVFTNLTSSEIRHFSVDEQKGIRFFIAFTHLVTIFCIIWFFIGHIWFIKAVFFRDYNPYYGYPPVPFTIVMVIIQYLMGIWLISPWFLRTFKQKKQNYSNQLSNKEKSVVGNEATISEKSIDIDGKCLILI